MVGNVNFPVDSPEWEHTNEGGMFVRLVVMSNTPSLQDYLYCRGGKNHVIMDESFIGTDELRTNNLDCQKDGSAWYAARDNEYDNHFPKARCLGKSEQGRGTVLNTISIPYLAVTTLGSTGWSGFSQSQGYWLCQYEDLTPEGKALYDSFKTGYPGTKVVLQTWLDT